ncbi:MAG: YCF48-related protein [bacterium]
MKKYLLGLIVLVLTVALLGFAIIGCGASETANTETTPTTLATTTTTNAATTTTTSSTTTTTTTTSTTTSTTTTTTIILFSVDFDNGTMTYGFAAGTDGTVLKTDDGGATWTLLETRPDDAADYHFANYSSASDDASEGSLFGENGTLYGTSNGGGNWNPLSYFDTDTTIFNENQNTDGVSIFVCSSGEVWRSTDIISVEHERADVSSITTGDLYHFKYDVGDENVVIAYGAGGKILYSDDAGDVSVATGDETWTNQSVSGVTETLYHGNIATNLGVALIVGENGKILSSADGETWADTIDSGTDETLRAISVLDLTPTFFCFGDNGTIIKSINGTSWTPVSQNATTADLYAADCLLGGTNIVAVGNGVIIRSTDSGDTWTVVWPTE